MDATISQKSVLEASKTVQLARSVFNEGRTKSVKFRRRQLRGFLKFLTEHEENLIRVMHEDMRKEPEEGRMEVIVGNSHVMYLLRNLNDFVRPEKVEKRLVDVLDGIYVYKEPYGVVLVMGAWNVPVLTLLPVAGAIAAGNSVIIKPSHNTPAFGNFLAHNLHRYLDPECYPVFLGNIPETNELLEQKFDYIYYTGSTYVGKIVHKAANKNLTPTTLELGGKNPVFIDSTVDMRITARRIIWGKCMNSGQTCVAPDYILCNKKVQKEFVEQAKIAIGEFYGANFLCPVINDFHVKRLVGFLSSLNVVVGGHFDTLRNAISPTIAVDVDPSHPIMGEEIFGPILPIITVNSVEEAVQFINNKPKPLALYVFSSKKDVQNYIMDSTSSGSVTINDTMMQIIVESLPFGGVGLSGMGLYKGRHSFDTFTHRKSILHKNSWKIVENINRLRYPPFSKKKSKVVEFMMKSRPGISWFYFIYLTVFLLGFLISFLIFHDWS